MVKKISENLTLVRYATEEDSGWIMAELAKFADFDKSMAGLFSAPQEYKDKLFKKLIKEDLFLVAEVGDDKAGFICEKY